MLKTTTENSSKRGHLKGREGVELQKKSFFQAICSQSGLKGSIVYNSRRQPHNLKRELYRTNDFDDNEMETVLCHCYVMGPNEYAKATGEGDDVFLCEYEYEVKWHSFKRVAEAY